MFHLRRFTLITLIAVSIAACARATPLPLPEVVNGEQLYQIEEVRIESDHASLAGTLLTPLTDASAPAVVVIPGSGPATRNGSWNMYRHLGEYLVQRGLAVLLYDKRGVGGSTGNWKTETFDERAQDIAAMVGYLKSRPEINPVHIGLVGHSQGAYIAPLVVAQSSSDVAFVVLLAGSGQKVWDQILTNERAEALGNGESEADIEKQVADLEGQLQLVRQFAVPCRTLGANYLCYVLDYDPAPVLEKITVPTLALYAELDTQVPPDINRPLVEAALQTAGNTDYTLHTFPSANHWFAPAEIGTTAEMRELTQHGQIGYYEFVPEFLEILGDWIVAHAW